jgi:hypothetical protein
MKTTAANNTYVSLPGKFKRNELSLKDVFATFKGCGKSPQTLRCASFIGAPQPATPHSQTLAVIIFIYRPVNKPNGNENQAIPNSLEMDKALPPIPVIPCLTQDLCSRPFARPGRC